VELGGASDSITNLITSMIGAFISHITNNIWNISNHNDIMMNIQTLNISCLKL
jgi:hypothetical protein